MNPLQLNVTVDTTQAEAAASGLKNLTPLLRVMQRRGVNELKKHFAARNAEPNSMGWPKTNFWNREGRDNTGAGELTDQSAMIVVASAAIAHKVKGGTITAKRGKMLAIPLTAEAYKAGSPREANMPGLFLMKRKGDVGRAFLAIADPQPGGSKPARSGKKGLQAKDTGGIRPQYLLIRSVNQRADPRTLPDPAAFAAAIHDEAEKFLVRRTARSA
jgi:hypothetical protein